MRIVGLGTHCHPSSTPSSRPTVTLPSVATVRLHCHPLLPFSYTVIRCYRSVTLCASLHALTCLVYHPSTLSCDCRLPLTAVPAALLSAAVLSLWLVLVVDNNPTMHVVVVHEVGRHLKDHLQASACTSRSEPVLGHSYTARAASPTPTTPCAPCLVCWHRVTHARTAHPIHPIVNTHAHL